MHVLELYHAPNQHVESFGWVSCVVGVSVVKQVVCIEEEGCLLVQGIVGSEAPIYDGALIGTCEGDALQVSMRIELGDDAHAGIYIGAQLWSAGEQCTIALEHPVLVGTLGREGNEVSVEVTDLAIYGGHLGMVPCDASVSCSIDSCRCFEECVGEYLVASSEVQV